MAETRGRLRADLRSRRSAVDAAARFAAASRVGEQLAKLQAFTAARTVAGYWAVDGELPLSAVVAAIARAGVATFLLPRLVAEGGPTLEFVPWKTGDAIVANRFGIPEPAAMESVSPANIDIVLLPMVGFDRSGARLGTGGGYYDRTFAFRREAPSPPLLIGIAFACQEIAHLELAQWDVGVDFVATDCELIDCRKA